MTSLRPSAPCMGSGVVFAEPPRGLHSGRGWGSREPGSPRRVSSEKVPDPPSLGVLAQGHPNCCLVTVPSLMSLKASGGMYMFVCVCVWGPARACWGLKRVFTLIQSHVQRSHDGGRPWGWLQPPAQGSLSGAGAGVAARILVRQGEWKCSHSHVYFSKLWGCLLMASQRAVMPAVPPPHPNVSVGPLGCPEH